MFETFCTRRWPLMRTADWGATTWGGGTATGVATTRSTCPPEFWNGLIGGATPGGFEIVEDQCPGRVVQCLKGSHLSSVVAFFGSLPPESPSLSVGEAVRCLPQGVLFPLVPDWMG